MNFNEHTVNDSPNQAGPPEPLDDVTMPLGAESFGEQEFVVAEQEGTRKLNSGALLIVAVVAIAAIGLFSMRTLTRVSAADEEPQVIAQSIDEFLEEVLKQSDGSTGRQGVLDVLNEPYAARQVPLDAVQRNPFILFEDQVVEAPVMTSPQDTLAPRRQARLSQFEKAAERLRLNMVLMGSQPLATVNNRIVRIGESVIIDDTVEFKVVNITADRVDFVAEDTALDVKFETAITLRRN